MLERVRQAAKDWRTAQVSLLGLITVVSVLKGPDSIASLDGGAKVWVGVLLLLALVCAGTGTYLLAEVAYGLPRALARFRTQPSVDDVDLALHGALRLRVGLGLTFVALALMAGAIGTSWYGPSPAKLSIRIDTAAGTFCGELVSGDATTMLISTKQGRQAVAVRDIVSTTPATC
jgi:hypothetical protein